MNEHLPKVRKLVKSTCATYAGNDRCLYDHLCGYMHDRYGTAYRCPYFESSVLPNDKALEDAYLTHHGEKVAGGAVCAVCSATFERKSNRQKYCSTACSRQAERHKAKQRMKDYRYNKNHG
ncbi:cysteine-rich VLP protein [Fictibacillus phosphorivorans]|uniref:cysteine-rich VLP protein n=1 Tax=Fictibacillus phosphorivorans TaxID=1221500 RepID=UPI003CE8B39A